jgi:hypothetical protein
MTDVDTAAETLSEVQTLCVNAGSFSSPLAQKMAVDGKTSLGMYIQLHLLASHVLTSKLVTCFHHLQVHGGKCSVTHTCTSEACNKTYLSMCISYLM